MIHGIIVNLGCCYVGMKLMSC